MGDYVDEHGVGRNLTPGALYRLAKRLDDEPQSGRLATDREEVDNKDPYRQNLTEGGGTINLLFTYRSGQMPLVMTCDTYKDVFKLLGERSIEGLDKEHFPVYLLKIDGDRVVLGKKIYPPSDVLNKEGDNV